MSIVIAALKEGESINLFADRRLVVKNDNGSYHEIGEIKKIYELSDTISCGITGDAKWGIDLAQELIKQHDKPASILIQLIKNNKKQFKTHSTFSLVGKYDDGDLFVFGFKTSGGELFFKNETNIMIQGDETDSCSDFLLDLYNKGYEPEYYCKETINFASQINPEYISNEVDHIQIKL